MKSIKRVLVCILITSLMFPIIPGTSRAATHILPYSYPYEANVETYNDVWVVVYGGSAAPPITNRWSLVEKIRSVDVTLEGKATCDAEIIINSFDGWIPTRFPATSVNGKVVLSVPISTVNPSYLEVIVNLRNKSEGRLTVTKMEFKDEVGAVILTDDGTIPNPPYISKTTLNGIIYELNSNTLTAKVAGYSEKPEIVVIPSQVTVDSVPTASGSSFDLDVVFTITEIGENAFRDCTDITSITLPETITNISASAFEGCPILWEVKLPSSLKSIDEYAFSWCGGLHDIELPTGITYIAEDAFYGSDNVNVIAVEGSYAHQYAVDNGLIRPIDYTFVDGVLTVNGSGPMKEFWNTDARPWNLYKDDITSVIIAPGVTTIGGGAFEECHKIKSVYISEGVTEIGPWAFLNAKDITEVRLPSTLQKIYNGAFAGCDSLARITIPDSVTFLADDAFEGNDNLKFNIIFDSMGGPLVPSISQAYNSAVSEPAEPRWRGYSFGGWYIDEGFTNRYTFTTMPAKDIILYAKWIFSYEPTPEVQPTPSPTPTPIPLPKDEHIVKENEDGSKTETTTNVETYEDGSQVIKKTKVDKDIEGNVSTLSEAVEITDKDKKATAVVNITKDDQGNIEKSNSYIKIDKGEVIEDEKKTEIKVAVDKNIVNKIKETAEVKDSLKVEIKLPDDQIVKKVLSASNDKPVAVSIELPSEVSSDDKLIHDNITLSKKVLSRTKDMETTLSVSVKDEHGEESFSWSFDGAELKNSDKSITDVNLMMSVSQADKHENTQKIVSELNKEDVPAITVSFNHSGVLPATARVKVNLKNILTSTKDNNEKKDIKPGSEVYVYYYNNTTGKLESLPNNKYVIDENGFITMMITHCSEYIILPEPVDNDLAVDLLSQIVIYPSDTVLYYGGTIGNTTTADIKMPATLKLVSEFTDKEQDSAIAEVILSFESDNSNVVEVSDRGLIKATGLGTAMISDTHTYLTGEAFLKSGKAYDLIFLDIEMPVIDGIETAKLYRERHGRGLIVFQTNHMEMIQSGYLVNAFRFIEKNGDDEKFREALQSAAVIISNRKKVCITTIDGIDIVLDHEDIVYIETVNRGTKVVTLYDNFFTKEKISDMAYKLGGSCFYQSHRAFIVNLNHILKYDKENIYLKGNHIAFLSVKKINEFKEVYYNWKFRI